LRPLPLFLVCFSEEGVANLKEESVMASVKAGSPELRKCLRRFKGYTLRGNCGHAELVGPDGKVVRMSNGVKISIASSPKNGADEAKHLTRKLASIGILPS
jgi:hypothetical protein